MRWTILIKNSVSLAMEAIGDITASAEVSRVAVEGYEFDTRIQGGVLGDGIGESTSISPRLMLTLCKVVFSAA